MLRIENFIDINKIKVDDWSDWRNPSTFMELTTPENAEQVSKQLAKYIPARNKARTDVVIDSYLLEPFKSNYDQDDIRQAGSTTELVPRRLSSLRAWR